MKKNNKKNKAVYTPPQSRTGGQVEIAKKRSHFVLVTDGPTDTARSRVASPRLKMKDADENLISFVFELRVYEAEYWGYP